MDSHFRGKVGKEKIVGIRVGLKATDFFFESGGYEEFFFFVNGRGRRMR